MAEVIQIDARKAFARILMLLLLALALVWSWFVVRWYVGNTMAEYFDPDEGDIKSLRTAVSLAPNDPLPHWRLGDIVQRKFPPDQLGQAIQEYEKAVSLSPNDYRFWMSLGRALEEYGDTERAEKALRRSVELAPSYSYPAWFLGNLLLRDGRYPEAFAELRRASESNAELRPQLFNLAWEVYNADIETVKTAIGSTPEARAQFAEYLLGRDRADDGLKVWGTLSESEKKANRDAGKSMLTTLLAAKRFHEAMSIWNDLSPSINYRASIGKILDGGFEDDLPREGDTIFGWQVKTAPQTQIGIDVNTGHASNRSLRLTFQVNSRLDAINVSQVVAVLPATTYNFECYIRTQNLQSAATPIIQIADAADGSIFATSDPAPLGTNGWQRLGLTFKTGEKSGAVVVRFARASCGDNSVCPIFGTVWYDDFSLSR
ncbi:MAG TPA: tetratricopeptide repeat protein [Pyrinomonadaceae bacterium]|nr:tetratricopeptide repeat protein [Pyrinomonadaceae bacterium]